MSMLLGQNRRRDLSNELRINPRCELLIAYTDQAALAWAARCADGYSSDAPLLDDLFETPISIIGPFGGLGAMMLSRPHESLSPGKARHQDSELFRMDGQCALHQLRSITQCFSTKRREWHFRGGRSSTDMRQRRFSISFGFAAEARITCFMLHGTIGLTLSRRDKSKIAGKERQPAPRRSNSTKFDRSQGKWTPPKTPCG